MFHEAGIKGKGKTRSLVLVVFALVGAVIWYFINNNIIVKTEKDWIGSDAVNLIKNHPSVYLNADKIEQKNTLPDKGDKGDVNLSIQEVDTETQLPLLPADVSIEDTSKVVKQYKQKINQIEKSQAQLAAIQEELLSNKRLLEQLNDEWSQNTSRLQEYQKGQEAARAAANYELPSADEVDALLGQLRSGGNSSRQNHPTGIPPQVVNRVQDTTGISANEIESLMNK